MPAHDSGGTASMSPYLKPEYLKEFRAKVRAQALDIALHVARTLMDEDGLVYGEVKLGLEERITKMIYDLSNGTLDELAAIRPDLAEKDIEGFERDARKLGY